MEDKQKQDIIEYLEQEKLNAKALKHTHNFPFGKAYNDGKEEGIALAINSLKKLKEVAGYGQTKPLLEEIERLKAESADKERAYFEEYQVRKQLHDENIAYEKRIALLEKALMLAAWRMTEPFARESDLTYRLRKQCVYDDLIKEAEQELAKEGA